MRLTHLLERERYGLFQRCADIYQRIIAQAEISYYN